ncbi:MAG: peptidoglycan-binding protein [Lewinellaceae bacterium]|nr:peptidoglycan-binding protein [Lewinellaceae bacterium]
MHLPVRFMAKFNLTLLSYFVFLLALNAQPGDLPDARAGKCYAKCLVHDKFETITEQLMLKPASSEMTVVPATFETITAQYATRESYLRLIAEPPVFETVEEKILIAPAGQKVNPGSYEAVEEQVLLKPATKYFVVSEAQLETVQEPIEIEQAYMQLEALPRIFEPVLERVEVRPPTTRWVRKKADRDCLSADPDDCFVWCMVEVPAQYQMIYRQVDMGCDGKGSSDCGLYQPVEAKTKNMPVQKVIVPANARELVEPAEYITITKWVLKSGASEPAATGAAEYKTVVKKLLKTPAHVREETVPAVYAPIQRKVVKTPATFVSEPTPEELITITKRRLLRKGGFSAWREIICSEKMTGYTIRQIQEALRALGYFQGTISGTMNTQTKTALVQFQQERDLPADGNVDFETLKALGIGY